MELVINITLLILGFIGSLTAIGGETWRKDESNLWRKITPIGWLAVCCLVLILILGIVKEIKLNATTDRMKTLDKILIEYSKDKTPFFPSNKIGNVAGYVKDRSGRTVPKVAISRINGAQTFSHKDGEFIVTSIHEGETLKFQKDGYKTLEYKVKSHDFENLVEITIK